MNRKELKELIKNFLQEYTGTGASGGNAGDGNNITSPRIGGSFLTDEDELLDYMYKSIYGGDGGHYKNYSKTQNYNSTNKQGMFELKKYIEKAIKEQAYGSATLTTQGQAKSSATAATDEYPFSARPKGRLPGVWEQEEDGPSYDEVYLRGKLVGFKDAAEYDKDKHQLIIYPDLGEKKWQSRSTQEIVFRLERGDLHFVRAFGMERTYQELKNVFPELPEMRGSSYSGFMNVGEESIPVDLDTAHKMIQALNIGREGESAAQSSHYTREPGRGGTGIDEQISKASQKAFDWGLKKLQKAVLRYQLRWIEKQKSSAVSQASTAASQASQGFEDQIKALEDQIRAIDNPPKDKGKKQNENILEGYLKDRKNANLMNYIDVYKQSILLENTIKKFFEMFEDGETNEELTRQYAEKGITIPEQFLVKIRKQFETLKKQKLEMEFSEQEAKEIVFKPTIPDAVLFDLDDEEVGEDDKKLTSRLYKEAKIKRKYKIPPEIEEALTDTLKMNPLVRFVKGLKAVNSIPPSYRIFLLNNEHFDIYYETFSLMVKIGPDEYYLGDIQERNTAIKHINRLLTQSSRIKGDGEDSEIEPPDPDLPGPAGVEEPAEEPSEEEPTA